MRENTQLVPANAVFNAAEENVAHGAVLIELRAVVHVNNVRCGKQCWFSPLAVLHPAHISRFRLRGAFQQQSMVC